MSILYLTLYCICLLWQFGELPVPLHFRTLIIIGALLYKFDHLSISPFIRTYGVIWNIISIQRRTVETCSTGLATSFQNDCSGFSASLVPGRFDRNLNLVIFQLITKTNIISCEFTLATNPPLWLVNIGSGYGLVPSGNKSLPEPMLTKFYDATWRH